MDDNGTVHPKRIFQVNTSFMCYSSVILPRHSYLQRPCFVVGGAKGEAGWYTTSQVVSYVLLRSTSVPRLFSYRVLDPHIDMPELWWIPEVFCMVDYPCCVSRNDGYHRRIFVHEN